ncbi:basic amino acid ABC transporter substrate-binding protein [Bacillus alkalicellulosilyticus]|uniref:basic amino acid ABC transporter substrate-binding protein n=1 Tax=Alkalihalobacterium alkalicellulosilyticum TaxID=1912214 RepID=UPI000998A546|nr:basic amino acid ABC transporter substrate-binding protein [Bacillus alkalicellulosilyticus]
MKKLFSGIVALSLLALAACGSADTQGSGGNESSEAEESKKIVIGTDAAFAPFEFLDKGEIVGFDVDLISAVLEEVGLDFEINNVGWDPIPIMLNNNEIDIAVSAMTITEDRLESFDFSNPYFESTHMMVFKEGTNITNANDLVGLKIGVQTATTGQTAAEKIVGENDSSISKYENTAVAFMALQNGDVDVVVTDNVVAFEYVQNNPEQEVIALDDTTNFDAEYYGFMFKKDNDLKAQVNAGLKTVIENGTYSEIYEKWFGEQPNVDLLLELME